LIQGYLTTKSIDTSALTKRKRLQRKRSNNSDEDADPGFKKSRGADKTLKRANSDEDGAVPKKTRAFRDESMQPMQTIMKVDQRSEPTGGATIVVFSENYESARSDIKILPNSLIVPARRMQNTSMALQSKFTRANGVFFLEWQHADGSISQAA